MHLQHISELLAPFLSAPLSEKQLSQLASYLEILHRWNARMNLTAVRDPEQVVTRHFGESLFAAQNLFPNVASIGDCLIDIGSGAGFPGLPIKIWQPELDTWLLESQGKKATFLNEVVRALEFRRIFVINARAEQFDARSAVGPGALAGAAPDQSQSSDAADASSAALRVTVTLRAVEKFERILPVAAQLATGGRLALLIGSIQVEPAKLLAPSFHWSAALPIPHSLARVLLVGESR